MFSSFLTQVVDDVLHGTVLVGRRCRVFEFYEDAAILPSGFHRSYIEAMFADSFEYFM